MAPTSTGPLAGVSYDGVDPQYADLYHDAGCAHFVDKLDWNDDGIPDSWKQHYLDRMTDLIDKYQPDLLYTDGHLPFEEYGLKMVVASLQRERAVARRGDGGGLHQQAGIGLRGRHLPARSRARRFRWHRAESLADRHLHRPVALQARREVQDAPRR